MSSRVTALFHQGFSYSIGAVFLVLVVLMAIPWNGGLQVSFPSGASILMASLIALWVPTLFLQVFGEWWLTRSWGRHSFLAQFRKAFLPWWGGLSLALLGLTFLSHILKEIPSWHELSWSVAFGFSALSLAGLLILTLPISLWRSWLLPTVIYGAALPFLLNWPQGQWLFWGLTLVGLVILWRLHQSVPGDMLFLDPERPFAPLLEQPRWLDMPGHYIAQMTLKAQSGGRWRLLTVHGYLLSLLLFLGSGVLWSGLVLWRLLSQGYDETGYFALEGVLTSMALSLGWLLCFIPLGPRLLMRDVDELIATRSSRLRAYLSNWCLNGFFLAIPILFVGFLSFLHPHLRGNLRWEHLILLWSMFWLGGYFLMPSMVLAWFVTASWSPFLLLGGFSLFFIPSLAMFGLWGALIAMRLWDIWRYFHPEQTRLQTAIQGVLGGVLWLVLVGVCVQSQALSRNMGMPFQETVSPYYKWQTGQMLAEALFLKQDLPESRDFWRHDTYLKQLSDAQIMRRLVKHADDRSALLDYADAAFAVWQSEYALRHRYDDADADSLPFALQQSRQWLSALDPTEPDIQQRNVALLIAEGRYAEAQTQLKSQKGVLSVEWQIQQASLQAHLFHYRDALAAYSRLPEQGIAGYVWLQAAELAIEAGALSEAIRYLNRSWQSPSPVALYADSASRLREWLRAGHIPCSSLETLVLDPGLKQVTRSTLNDTRAACEHRPEQIKRKTTRFAYYLAQGDYLQAERLAHSTLDKSYLDMSYWAQSAWYLGRQPEPMVLEWANYYLNDVSDLPSGRLATDVEVPSVAMSRARLHFEPHLDSVWRLLLESHALEQDWKQIRKHRFADQDWQAITQFKQDTDRLYAAYAEQGAPHLTAFRSSMQLRALAESVVYLPTASEELKASAERIKTRVRK